MMRRVGRIGRAHGLRGELAVEVRTDAAEERFAPGAVLHTEPEGVGPLTVAAVRPHVGRLLVSFAEIGDRTAAEPLTGTWLTVDTSALPPPEEPDVFDDDQLIGLAGTDVAGVVLGAISGVEHGAAGDSLLLRQPDGRVSLVPFVAALVPEVDLGSGRVVLDLPAGLLDL